MGPATWYALVRLYTAVTNLSELRSEGQQFYAISWSAPNGLQEGSTGDKVRQLQYMLSILAAFIPSIPVVAIDGIYGSATRAAVLAVQHRYRLPETGVVDGRTWEAIYNQFSGIETTALRSGANFPQGTTAQVVPAGNFRTRPGRALSQSTQPALRYNRSTTFTQFPGNDLTMGARDPVPQEVVR